VRSRYHRTDCLATDDSGIQCHLLDELPPHAEGLKVVTIGRRTKQHSRSIQIANAFRPGNRRFVVTFVDKDEIETRELRAAARANATVDASGEATRRLTEQMLCFGAKGTTAAPSGRRVQRL
jgi:hypothetical protein